MAKKRSIVKFNKDGHLQRIKAHYLDETFQLSEFEKELLERLRFVFTLRLKNKFSRKQAVDKLVEEYKISQATAQRDYNSANELFGDLDVVDAKAEKLVLREEYWFLYQKLLTEGKWEAAEKVLNSYEKLIPKEKLNEYEIDKISAHIYNIKMSKKGEKAFLKMAESGVADFNDFTVEDTEFEILPDVRKKD